MKHIALTLLMTLSLGSAWGQYYEDHEVVAELAASGNPSIDHQSESCPRKYGNQELVDRLGKDAGYDTLCVKHIRLPKGVLSEVITMKEHELYNESDYDQRLTALYVFEQDSFSPNGYITPKTIKKIAKGLGIPTKQVVDPSFGTELISNESFGQFEGLYIGDGYEEDSRSLRYLRNLLKGKLALTVTFGDGVELYPGGGFSVTHYLIFVDGKLVYVKMSWWDA